MSKVATAPAPVKPSNVSAPVDAAKPAKPEKVKAPKRAPHPFIDGPKDVYPLTQVPDDYDPAKHANLKRRDFANETNYIDYRIKMLDIQRAELVKEREDAVNGVGKKEKAMQARMVKMKAAMDELRKKLVASGVDVDAVLNAAGATA